MWVKVLLIGTMWAIALWLFAYPILSSRLAKGETSEEAVNHLWGSGYSVALLVGWLAILAGSSFRAPFLIWLLVIGEIAWVCFSVPLTTMFYIQGRPYRGVSKFSNPLTWVFGFLAQIFIPLWGVYPWIRDSKRKKNEAFEKQAKAEEKEYEEYLDKKERGLL